MISTTRSGSRERADLRPATVVLRATIVGLALSTAAIHISLGGTLFTLNAIGYVVLAAGIVLPGLGRVRWLVRLGLLGYTAATIGAWLLFGPRFPLAYVDKAVEVVLVTFLLAEVWLLDGGPAGIIRAARATLASVLAVGRHRAS
jgi:hypothetical protein